MSRIRIAAVLAALALAPAAAHAQSTITACYVPKTGSVYRVQAVGAPDACKPNHVEFSWASSGPTFTKRWATPVLITPNTFEQAFASCEAGETVVGGGYATFPNLTVSVAVNAPTFGGLHPESWFVDMRNLSSIDVTMSAYVICAKPAT
jgi:hypothetical protein